MNPNSGLCLDDPNSTTTNGTQLHIWTCNNTGAQVWDIPHAGHTFVGPVDCDHLDAGAGHRRHQYSDSGDEHSGRPSVTPRRISRCCCTPAALRYAVRSRRCSPAPTPA